MGELHPVEIKYQYNSCENKQTYEPFPGVSQGHRRGLLLRPLRYPIFAKGMQFRVSWKMGEARQIDSGSCPTGVHPSLKKIVQECLSFWISP